jgi:hypothetical protein
VTHHPEVILGSIGEFETCPDWVPSLDAIATIDCMPACTKELTRFERTGIYAARVRNVSRLGSHAGVENEKLYCIISVKSFVFRFESAKPGGHESPAAMHGLVNAGLFMASVALLAPRRAENTGKLILRVSADIKYPRDCRFCR